MHQNGHEEVSKLPLFLPPRELENPKKNETHVWGGSVTYESRYSIKKILGIENIYSEKDRKHCLLCGPPGCGKTTVAKILCKICAKIIWNFGTTC